VEIPRSGILSSGPPERDGRSPSEPSLDLTYRERKRYRKTRKRNKVLLALGILGTCILIATLAGIGYMLSVAASAPPLRSLKPVDQGTSSVVFAADGTRLGFIQSDEIRTPVAISRIPQWMQDATVAIEDERFYQHGGVDYEGIVRAVWKDIKAGRPIEGGSTITQQLVRNLYVGRERTFQRKIREAKLADELESEHSKRWILQSYLNSVAYGTVDGQTAIGVQAAAQTFFAKNAWRLTLEEAALLAGLPQAPSELNPFQNPKGALDRRNRVLRKMAKLGYITPARALEAEDAPLGVRRGTLYTRIREPFFFDYVKQELIDRFGINTVRRGGLRVYTTIYPKLQATARAAIDSTLPYPTDPTAAIVAIDPRTGYIRAMASGSNYSHNQFNLAAQGHRQPGSAFKPFVLTTAIERGINPYSTTYVSRPLDLRTRDYGPWKVQTYDQTYGGTMNLVRATLRSDNTIYAQLDLDLGPKSVAETAKKMGITTKLDGYPAEGLGGLTRGVSPLEMADAYATLAAGGIKNKPIAIKRVVFPGGAAEDLGKPKRERVLSDAVAYEVTKILKMNVLEGTGTAANIGCPAAGKTGTTDNFNDAWFVGYTPTFAAATWVGYPNALREMRSVHGISVAGGTFPAQIWHKFMAIAKGAHCEDFKPPTTPIRWTPFFGKYSGQQGYSSGSYSYGGQGNSSGGGYGGYDPRAYSPQPAPPIQTNPPPASNGTGGNGNGNGHGNGAPTGGAHRGEGNDGGSGPGH
jgi:penicillin-binding protein 1A